VKKRRAKPAAEAALLAELDALYAEVEAQYEGRGCAASTECCRFGVTGREPYVTSIETAAVKRAIRARGGPVQRKKRALPLTTDASREQICPLLTREGSCAIYAARPLGCRTFWCERASGGRKIRHREVRDLVRRVEQISVRHHPEGDRGRPLRRALALERWEG